MANKENQPPRGMTTYVSSISPSNKPALNRQRDHSGCRRPETPLKVRKTRENLKEHSIYGDIPPPCLHFGHDHDGRHSCSTSQATVLGSAESKQSQDPSPHHTALVLPPSEAHLHVDQKVQRQKSISRRMFSKVKEGIASRSKSSQRVRPADSETALARKLSERRRESLDTDRPNQSFEISRESIESTVDETPESIDITCAPVQRSATDSTVSTAGILGDSVLDAAQTVQEDRPVTAAVLDLSQCHHSSPRMSSSPSAQATPRPPKTSAPPLPQESHITVIVPFIDLNVVLERASIDVHSKCDVWIMMEATVKTKPMRLNPGTTESGISNEMESTSYKQQSNISLPGLDMSAFGAINSLRLCYKPMKGCRIREIVGQKGVKNPVTGQQCVLFIKLHIPKVHVRESTSDPDQESLFAELESIVGTLEMDIMHIEARYRHSMLPPDNVVGIRHICKVARPKTESRWSLLASADVLSREPTVHSRLARYLASQYSAERALELIDHYLSAEMQQETKVRDVYSNLTTKPKVMEEECANGTKPSVVVTDIDLELSDSVRRVADDFSTAPSTPIAADDPLQPPPALSRTCLKGQSTSMSFIPPPLLAPPLISVAKTTTALTKNASASTVLPDRDREINESQDTARQLWRHIRRTSLSARQLELMTPEQMQHLEASDETIRDLRQQALANKRSVGAETLRAWKWEESTQRHAPHGEAPWM